MHTDKKLTKEDTWRPADLRKHIRDESQVDSFPRRRDDYERKHRGGESTERRRRDPEKESRRERDKHGERESTREGRGEVENDRYADRHKEGSRDRRGDKDRDRRDERERERRRERDKLVDGKRNDDDHRDRRQDREEKYDREKDKERHRDKDIERDRERRREERDKEKHRDKEAEREKDREKRREERDKERRREERNREHRSERERRRHEEVGEGERDLIEKHEREKRERHGERQRHNDEYEDKRADKERRERHGDRKHSETREEREHRRHKEERERRHKERGHQDEKRMPDSESRERRSLKGSDGEVRHHRSDRERAERDRHKERRHKERTEREPEENQKGKDGISSSKKIEKTDRHETYIKEVAAVSVKQAGDSEEPVINAEEQAEQEYEDDFEEYEEDFEEMDESANEDAEEKESQNPEEEEEEEQRDELTAQRRKEIEAIRRAMDEENERVGTAQSRSSTSREEEEEENEPKWSRGSEKSQSKASHRGKFINFVAAKQREVNKKVATKQKKRSKELLRLIDLDFSMTVSLLDLPPVNEYDLYIRSFGNANTKQAYCQCNEDDADRDIQTEEIEVCEKWTQHPSEQSGDCGDPNLSQNALDRTATELSFDSQRLTAFLHSASQVMVVLLEEAQAEKKSLRKLKSETDGLSFSDGSLQLNTKLPFLCGRHIRLVHFSQVQRHTLMTVHDPTSKPSTERLNSCTIICIWNIREPSSPQKILFYESEVLCCCFSPRKASLVFAGTSVGSVVLWDLREQAKSHQSMKIGESEWTLRQPTFSTDAVMVGSGHFSSVTSVEVVPSAAGWGLGPEVPLLASEEESSGLSFQLASLDDSGVLNFWVVVELPKSNDAGSPTDLGLRPGGKVKLLHSSLLLAAERVSPRDAVKTGPVQTLHLKFLPTDSNHFFIGTNMGLVNHGTSHGLKAPPKFYRFQEAGVRPVEVTSINFSPFCSHLFLVGCGDGSIRLHTVSQEQPVAEWTNSTAGEPVVSLQWTQTRPAVFCALDSASNLHIWDLMKNEKEPVVTERIHSDRVTALAVFGDSGQQNTYSGIALAHESGKIEMQYFSRNFTVPILAEEEKLKNMMSEAF